MLSAVPFAVPMRADAQTVETIWSATLTPIQFQTAPTATGYGYNFRLGGSLSDTDFVYRGTTYTINGLTVEWVYGGSGYWRAGMSFAGQELPRCAQSIARFYSSGTEYTGSNPDYRIRNLSRSPHPPWANLANASVSITVEPVAPDPPTSLVSIVAGTQAMLSWVSSECDGGKDVTGHKYRSKQVHEASFGGWTPIPSSAANEANANSYTVLSIDSSQSYVFEVRAANGEGEGPPSNQARDGPVCRRTAQVRDAIVAAASATSCGDVSDADLAAITSLGLAFRGISSLKDGDFSGLTSLSVLRLAGNDLTALPDDVFEPLTALTTVNLQNNPGAPFSPEAVALPDDGTVSSTGGSVTLDGSGGGAWGTNVTYGWALTSPASGVTVMFDDAASAAPEVTIPALTVGTGLTFTLTVTGRGGGGGTAAATDTATVTVTASTDATLSDLELQDGDGNSVSLTPSFASTTTSYTANVANGVDEITIKPTSNSSATFAYLDGSDMALTDADAMEDDFQVSLSTGANTIKVKVTAQDSVTTRTYTVAVRRTTTANAATGEPAISGTARVGETLTAAKGTIADGDGTTKADAGDTGYAYAYQWIRLDSTGHKEDISGATSTTYMPMGADVDKKVGVKVTFTDDVDNPETVTSGGYPPSGVIRAAGFCGRTDRVVRLIIGGIRRLNIFDHTCADVTDTDLTTVTNLYLWGGSLLAAGDLDGLTSLTNLDIEFGLTTLPTGVFDELTSLTRLDLTSNGLTTLPTGVFDGLTSLLALYLEGNDLTTLPDGVFDELTALTELSL